MTYEERQAAIAAATALANAIDAGNAAAVLAAEDAVLAVGGPA